ncbi:unnamed protein product [Closterium sp. Yama58-4]|nr:unnamed protein product [Closterium sp. Yama58-4]
MAESHVANEPQLAPHVTATNATNTSNIEDIRKSYRIGKKIGTGRFGTVHEAVDRQTGVHVAVKAIPKDKYKCAALSIFRKKDKAEAESTLRLLRGEAEISQAIGGRQGDAQAEGQAEGRSNVVEVLSVIEGRRHMYIVMELCRGGSLASYLVKRRRGEVTGLAPAAPTAIESSAVDRGHAGNAGGKLSAHEQGAESEGEGEAEAESFAHRLRQLSSDDLSSSCAASDAGREIDDDHDALTAESRREVANHAISPATSSATAGYSALAFLERGAFGAARRQQQEREDEAAWVAYELASAVAYLHSQGIVHRDIKPENVLISLPPRLVLADFGLAERVKEDGTVRRGMVGSPAYISPEVAGGLTTGYPSDIWGIGICLFLTLSGGQLPFSGRDTRALLRNIRRVALPMGTAAWMGVSGEAKAVVRQLLAAKPSERPSAREIMEMPWVVEGRNRWLLRHYGQ